MGKNVLDFSLGHLWFECKMQPPQVCVQALGSQLLMLSWELPGGSLTGRREFISVVCLEIHQLVSSDLQLRSLVLTDVSKQPRVPTTTTLNFPAAVSSLA